MWAAEQAGARGAQPVLGDRGQGLEELDQTPDGGWYYNGGERKVTGTMTAAGLATLFITQDYLLRPSDRGNARATCKTRTSKWRWRGWTSNISGMLTAKTQHYYGMYGIERSASPAGGSTSARSTGTPSAPRTWSRTQAKDGAGAHEDEDPQRPQEVCDTVFAVLFLVRGRAPVSMNKLRVRQVPDPKSREAAGDRWNERPRDVANFAHWVSRVTEADLNWQIVNLKVCPDTLHDAPVLWMSRQRGAEPVRRGREEAAASSSSRRPDPRQRRLRRARRSPSRSRALGRKLFPSRSSAACRHSPDLHRAAVPRQQVEEPAAGAGAEQRRARADDPHPRGRPRPRPSRPARTGPGRAVPAHGQNIFLYAISQASERATSGETYVVRADPKVKADREGEGRPPDGRRQPRPRARRLAAAGGTCCRTTARLDHPSPRPVRPGKRAARG